MRCARPRPPLRRRPVEHRTTPGDVAATTDGPWRAHQNPSAVPGGFTPSNSRNSGLTAAFGTVLTCRAGCARGRAEAAGRRLRTGGGYGTRDFSAGFEPTSVNLTRGRVEPMAYEAVLLSCRREDQPPRHGRESGADVEPQRHAHEHGSPPSGRAPRRSRSGPGRRNAPRCSLVGPPGRVPRRRGSRPASAVGIRDDVRRTSRVAYRLCVFGDTTLQFPECRGNAHGVLRVVQTRLLTQP